MTSPTVTVSKRERAEYYTLCILFRQVHGASSMSQELCLQP